MDKQIPEAVPTAQTVAAVPGTQDSFLPGAHGAILRQDVQLSEVLAQCLGCPCEKANKYKIAPLPTNAHIPQSHGTPGWSPSQAELDSLPYAYQAHEQSDCCLNFLLFCCCARVNARAFKMPLVPYFQGAPDQFQIDKEFALGGCCCCPHSINVLKNGQIVARVEEDWNCSNYCCRYFEVALCCKTPYNVKVAQNGALVNKYKIDVNLFICGNHNNCCGATMCKNHMIWDIQRTADNHMSGKIVKSYGNGCSAGSFGRAAMQADQYLIEWNPAISAEEKASLIAATLLIDYVFFEQKDNN